MRSLDTDIQYSPCLRAFFRNGDGILVPGNFRERPQYRSTLNVGYCKIVNEWCDRSLVLPETRTPLQILHCLGVSTVKEI